MSVGGAYSDRVIDIDLLLYGDLVLDTPELKLPHQMCIRDRGGSAQPNGGDILLGMILELLNPLCLKMVFATIRSFCTSSLVMNLS